MEYWRIFLAHNVALLWCRINKNDAHTSAQKYYKNRTKPVNGVTIEQKYQQVEEFPRQLKSAVAGYKTILKNNTLIWENEELKVQEMM